MKTYIDLFAGCGGWSSGLSEAGWFNHGFYEINQAACDTAQRNFETKVSKIDLENNEDLSFPAVDVVVGSPPCQGFSNEGYKKKDDIRNNLVFSYYQIVKKIRPNMFIFENVPGFKRLYKGFFYKQFIELFEELGYSIESRILNFSDYGVPQNRKRFVAVGTINGKFRFPEPTHGSQEGLFKKLPLVTLWDAISDLPHVLHGERQGVFKYEKEAMNSFQQEMRNGSDMVYNHTTQSHSQRVLDKISAVPVGGNMSSIVGDFRENKTHYEGGYRRAKKDQPSYTAYWTRGMTSIHPELNRFLSPRECARIQSFPDRHIFEGNTIEHYTQICNAVPPVFAKALAEHINDAS